MNGRLRALINSATGEITLPLTLTSRMARSNSVHCASLIASLISPASAATLKPSSSSMSATIILIMTSSSTRKTEPPGGRVAVMMNVLARPTFKDRK